MSTRPIQRYKGFIESQKLAIACYMKLRRRRFLDASVAKGVKMPTRLNKRTVEALPPRPKSYEVRDDEQTGFLVRILPTGKRTFWYVYALGGKRSIRRRAMWRAESIRKRNARRSA